MSWWVGAALSGIVGGLLLVVSPGSLFVGGLIVLSILVVRRSAAPEDRRFLVTVLAAAVITRIAVAFSLHTIAFGLGHAAGRAAFLPGLGDDVGISGSGWELARFWQGARDVFPEGAPRFGLYFFGLHTYLHGLFYAHFGWTPLAMKYLNGLWGALSGVFVFWIAKELQQPSVARWACVLVAFFPSLFYWSVSNMKEPFIILLLCMNLWAAVRWCRVGRLRYAAYLLTGAVLLHEYRHHLDVPMALVVVAAVIGWAWGRARPAVILGAAALLCGLAVSDRARTGMQGFWQSSVRAVVAAQVGTAQTVLQGDRGQPYRIYPERYYRLPTDAATTAEPAPPLRAAEFLRALGTGFARVFLSPFPWELTTPLYWATFVQLLLWYPLLFCAFRGWAFLTSRHWQPALVLSMFLVTVGLGLALTEANTGTAIRHRDMMTPVIVLLGVLGMRQGLRVRAAPARAS